MTPEDQWPTLEQLASQEEELTLPSLTEHDAYAIGTSAVAAAQAEDLPVAIGLWRGHRQLFHAALPGSTSDNDKWLQRKGRVVMRFERSSLYMARLCYDNKTTLQEKFALPSARYAAAGGAMPLKVRGAGTLGWFGVSGLPQLDDHVFVGQILRSYIDSRR